MWAYKDIHVQKPPSVVTYVEVPDKKSDFTRPSGTVKFYIITHARVLGELLVLKK